MDGGAIAQWAATGIIGIAIIATWIKNGRNQAEKFGKLEGSLKGLSDRITELSQRVDDGMSNLNQRIDNILRK